MERQCYVSGSSQASGGTQGHFNLCELEKRFVFILCLHYGLACYAHQARVGIEFLAIEGDPTTNAPTANPLLCPMLDGRCVALADAHRFDHSQALPVITVPTKNLRS